MNTRPHQVVTLPFHWRRRSTNQPGALPQRVRDLGVRGYQDFLSCCCSQVVAEAEFMYSVPR
ncbi:hypothetical protein [Sciscionella marina]|uniref:hypothetical protein n=1 Tax=Sciscionella marina TaxID=508770 RepID=UPI0003A1A949|nr:hypothetical protein [Sciscionella marina]